MYQTAVHLDQEWESLQHSPVDWAEACPELIHCVSAGDVLAVIPVAPDAVLGFLIEQGQAGVELATRIIIQAFVGKLIRLSIQASARGRQDPFEDYLSSLWLSASQYPLDRRPTKIAANLFMDTLMHTRTNWAATGTAHEVAVGLEVGRRTETAIWDDLSGVEGTAGRLIIETACHSGWITEMVAQTLTDVYTDGLSGEQTAALRSCPPATVRSRCRDGVRRLREQAEALQDCCA